MLGTILKQLRKEKGLSQTDLADYLQITRGSYSNYETHKRSPDYTTLIKLAKFYEVSLDYLLEETTIRSYAHMDKQLKNLAKDDPLSTISEENQKKVLEYIQLLQKAESLDATEKILSLEKKA